MAANTEYKQGQDYQVIQEQIVRKRKPKWKKRLLAVCSTLSLGVLFGLVARYAFLVSDEVLISLFGLETEQKQEVHLSENGSPSIPTPILLPDATATPTPQVVLKPTKELTPTKEPQLTSAEDEMLKEDNAMDAHVQFYEEIASLAQNVKKAFVTVTTVESSVDWFNDTYETRKNISGILLGSNGIDLLILVNLADIEKADMLEVTLAEKIVCKGTVYSVDRGTGLAVIGVKQDMLSDRQKSELSFARITSQSVYAGMPILALGILNGHADAIEFGMVTSTDGKVSIVDGELSYYTTSIPEYAQASGFLVNFNGEIVGMLTHTMRQEQDESVLSAVSVINLQSMIQKLFNHVVWPYCGVKLSNIPENVLARENLEYGVYVTGVENGSPALLGGIQNGDIITEINGEKIISVKVFEHKLLSSMPEEVWNLTVLRGTQNTGKIVQITVILGQKNTN